jgi:hypothetical protein
MRYLLLPYLFSVLGCSTPEEHELICIEPKHGDLFNYPYFLFIPAGVQRNDSIYLIIEPNNSGMTHDSLQKHIDLARVTASKDFYIGNYVSRKLQLPLLVPVFPRPETEWHIYTHDLDRDVMLQKGTDLERIDLQLIEMFEDARKLLGEKRIEIYPQFFLTGFSASGSFTNRFTAIHPDRVAASSAGGTGGLLILPVDSLQNELMIFPNGVGDMEFITGRSFNNYNFMKTPQFYFLGELDTNDAVPYEDAYGNIEREQIYRIFGPSASLDRWDKCKNIYHSQAVQAVFKTYQSLGHEHPEVVKDDILDFFKNYID